MLRSLLRTLVVATALTAAAPSLAHAQFTLESGPWDTVGPCTTPGVHFNRLEVTTPVFLASFQIAAGILNWTGNAEMFLYSAPTAAGPYVLEYSEVVTSGTIARTGTPMQNLEIGHYLLGTSFDATAPASWNCWTYEASGTAAFSFGSLTGRGQDPAIALVDPYSPAIDANGLWRMTVTTGAYQVPPVADPGGPYVLTETNTQNSRLVPIDISGSYDPDGTIATVLVDCDTTVSNQFSADQWQLSGTIPPSVNCTYSPNDDLTATGLLRVTDNVGLVTSVNFTVQIVNGAPVATGVCGNGTCTGNEGDTLSFTCSATDPGWNDVPALTWDFDGTLIPGPRIGTNGIGDGNPFTSTRLYADDGTFSAICLAADDDGGSDQQALTVTIANVAPTMAPITGPVGRAEGQSASWTTTAADPGQNDVLVWTWSYGDSSPNGSTSSTTHTYLDEGSFTLQASVNDGDGGTDTRTLTVVVTNAPPTITATCPLSAVEGATSGFGMTAVDAGALDVLTWSVTGTSSASLLNPTGSPNQILWTPTYAEAQAGSVTLNVGVSDGDGGSHSRNCTIPVAYLDVDGDGMPDTWESANGLDTNVNDAGGDPDNDGLTNLQEWQAGSDPQAAGTPGTPVPVSPVAGAEVLIATPTFTFTNASDPDGDLLTYEVEVYAESTLSTLVDLVTGVTESATGTSSAIAITPLAQNTSYWWRVRADDGAAYGPWSTAHRFFVNSVNDAPSAPLVTWPTTFETVTTWTPTLTWTESADVDGDALTYEVVVAENAALTVVAWTEVGVVGLGNGTAAAMSGLLAEDGVYWVTVRAVDEHGLASGWATAQQFLISTVDDAPDLVSFVWPLDGGQVGSLAPDIEVTDGEDPEGLSIEYEIEIALDAGFTGAVWVSGPVARAGTTTVWASSSDGALLVEDAPAWVRARATDPGGLSSAWTTIAITANSVNAAPSVPSLIAPDGAAFTPDDTITFRFQNSEDSDGLVRTYEVEVRDDIGVVAWSMDGIVEGITETSVEVDAFDLPYFEQSWSARAVDELGLASAWATALDYEIVPPKGDDDDDDDDDDDTTGDDDDATGDDDDATGDDDDSGVPGGGCDCQADLAGARLPGASWALLGALLGLRRRRVSVRGGPSRARRA